MAREYALWPTKVIFATGVVIKPGSVAELPLGAADMRC
jgi:hypothetical protein